MDMTIAQLKYIVERKLVVDEHQCLLLFTASGIMPKHSDRLADLYAQCDQDTPLTIHYRVENTFG